MNETYTFENLSFSLEKGNKKPNDYIIKWYGEHQFSDVELFKELLETYKTEEEAKELITLFKACPFIKIDNCIKTEFTREIREKVYHYVNHQKIDSKKKFLLLTLFFRCDIDNLNYACPGLNGCIRHFMQIILLFGYHFKVAELMNLLPLPATPQEEIPELINKIGYPSNPLSINKNHWQKAYINYRNR